MAEVSVEHELKCWPAPFQEVWDERKPFEIRSEKDRHFNVGDTVVLREWCPDGQDYLGRWARHTITYVTRGPSWGLPVGLAVLGLSRSLDVGGARA